ncbi:MAG: hypothetical protein FWC68_01120 [Oscillospiraceae bacterium]|nr:hypothetical protein [Oscillospiraceae bacterium]
MEKLLKILAWCYMGLVLFLLVIAPIMLISDMRAVFRSGFATMNQLQTWLILLGIFLAPTLLIPGMRRLYYEKIPCLFAIVVMFFVNIIILGIAVMILNHGYSVQNSDRHTLFTIIMIAQIVGCRFLMSIYFHKKRVPYGGGMNG